MALSAESNITGLNHTLKQLHDNTIRTLNKLRNPRESTQNLERKKDTFCRSGVGPFKSLPVPNFLLLSVCFMDSMMI